VRDAHWLHRHHPDLHEKVQSGEKTLREANKEANQRRAGAPGNKDLAKVNVPSPAISEKIEDGKRPGVTITFADGAELAERLAAAVGRESALEYCKGAVEILQAGEQKAAPDAGAGETPPGHAPDSGVSPGAAPPSKDPCQ
jgi:hypothetical protein